MGCNASAEGATYEQEWENGSGGGLGGRMKAPRCRAAIPSTSLGRFTSSDRATGSSVVTKANSPIAFATASNVSFVQNLPQGRKHPSIRVHVRGRGASLSGDTCGRALRSACCSFRPSNQSARQQTGEVGDHKHQHGQRSHVHAAHLKLPTPLHKLTTVCEQEKGFGTSAGQVGST
eukprot:5230063-Prymnesium_polylepis.1